MNRHDPINEALARFRTTVPPEQVRNANRRAVRVALERPTATVIRWRTVAVPLPVALATAAALAISLTGHLLGVIGNGEQSPSIVAIEANSDIEATEAGVNTTGDAYSAYSETQRYVSGVGVVERNIIYWD